MDAFPGGPKAHLDKGCQARMTWTVSVKVNLGGVGQRGRTERSDRAVGQRGRTEDRGGVGVGKSGRTEAGEGSDGVRAQRHPVWVGIRLDNVRRYVRAVIRRTRRAE